MRATIVATLAALVFETHVFVAFQQVRVKVVQAPVAAASGVVRVTTAGFPRVKELRPPFALIARVKAPGGAASQVAIAVDGLRVCERGVAGGAARRIDCAVDAPWNPAIDHEVTLRGPQAAWTLEYLELATHHGNTSGALTLFVLPRASTVAVGPAWGDTFALWIVLAGIVLFVPPHTLRPRVRLLHRAVAGLVLALAAVVQCSEWVSDYRLVITTGTFAMYLALLLAPRLWTAGRWLTETTERLGRRAAAVVEPRLAAFLDAHPAWRPGGAVARGTWHWGALALVVGFCCAPLFLNLREPNLKSDEAIHSWAVDRILDTGEWLTPRSLPDDSAFIEKPPLKFWVVAAGIRSGLLPRNELGLRWWDALFGAVAFVYVYNLGRRLSGPLCGLTAVVVLFTIDTLVFEHGLRDNNMDAATFLCYCGGIYHFARWVEADTSTARGHAAAVAAYFALGFMTKFVAVMFLPAVCVVAFAWRRGSLARLRTNWRDWIAPALLVCGLVAPWFIYQTVKRGRLFWNVILLDHVFKRFTTSLDPSHVHPWNHYFMATWGEFQRAGTQFVALAGIVWIAVVAFRGRSWLSRLVLAWGVLPFVAISFGSSKLVHYVFPFLPPIALAAGLVVADAAHAISGARGVALLSWLRRFVPLRVTSWCTTGVVPRAAVIGLASCSFALAAWTLLAGPSTVTILGARFDNRSVVWPVAAASALLFLGGYLRTFLGLAVLMVLAALAPVSVYRGEIALAERVNHPFRAIRECMTSVQQSGARVGQGVYGSSVEMEHWTYYYYLWRLGEWKVGRDYSLEEAEKRIWTPGEQTPVLVSRANYEKLVRRAAERETTGPGVVRPAGGASVDPIADAARDPLRSGVSLSEDVGLLLPGPFRPCLPDVMAAAGQPLWKNPLPERRR